MPAIQSTRLDAELHLGKRDARAPTSSHVKMGELLKALPSDALPPIPQHFGHGYDFGRTGWLMLGNGPDDTVRPGFGGCGDCAWAGPAHEEMEAARNAHAPIPAFSGATVVKQYAEYSGYDPKTGDNDNGSDLQEVLTWRQDKGLRDDSGAAYKIGKSVALTPGDIHQLWAATYLFETAGIGIQFQQAQTDQFDMHEPWDYVKGSPIEGGHYVPTMGDNGLISWGERVGFTVAFIENLCDEAYTYVDPERYNKVTGETLEHHVDADLEKYIVLVAQAKQQV